MPGRRWDDRWEHYPESKPLRAEGGLPTSRKRGAMAGTWWSRRFTDVLESYGLGARMQRGRRYARSGQVVSLEIRPGSLIAQVQGSRRTPYIVTIELAPVGDRAWGEVEGAVRSRVGFAARLLAGEIPEELEDVFRAAGVELFPPAWSAITSRCSCPDWENPCKHIAAVLYVFADRLDADPRQLIAWRGRSADELLAHLRSGPPVATAGEVAPWWPFAPGDLPPSQAGADPLALLGGREPTRADPPAAILDGLTDVAIEVRGTPVVELLRPAYQHLVRDAET